MQWNLRTNQITLADQYRYRELLVLGKCVFRGCYLGENILSDAGRIACSQCRNFIPVRRFVAS